MLRDAKDMGFDDIVCWLPGEQTFIVLDHDRFEAEILPRYFSYTKYKSLHRQCTIYGFMHVHHGPHQGGYAHKFFNQNAPELCSEIKRKISPISQEPPKILTGNHRRVASFDFLDAVPAAFPAALPPKRHHRHRRVVSWDVGAKTPTNMTAQDRFDFGIMVARETVHDISPCSPLRHHNDPLKIEYMEDPLQPYPCHKSSMKPHTGNTTNHPLKRVSPPVSTLPSADNLQAPSTTICVKSSTMRQLSTVEQQEQSSSMVVLKTLEDDDADIFKDLFAPNEREEGIDLLLHFDGGHPQECGIFNKDDDMTLYAHDVMPACACSRVRDEVVDLAGNINMVDLPAGLEPLPPMIEPEPLSLPTCNLPTPSDATISHLIHGISSRQWSRQ